MSRRVAPFLAKMLNVFIAIGNVAFAVSAALPLHGIQFSPNGCPVIRAKVSPVVFTVLIVAQAVRGIAAL
jgi:hypothetical protein